MSFALNLDRRPAMERGEPKTDFRPQRDIEPPDIPTRSHVNLAKLEATLSRNPLEEITLLVKALTYGEMMELGEALWKAKPEGEVTQDALPGILHRWATGGTTA